MPSSPAQPRGIGLAIAEAMAREGARVVSTDRDGNTAAATAAALGTPAIAVRADVAVPADILALFEATATAFGGVDILVNNAGIGAPRLLDDVELEAWARILRFNQTGAFVCSQQAAPQLIPQRRHGLPEEIAGAAVFLASDEAAYINGHTLNVDGGFLAASS